MTRGRGAVLPAGERIVIHHIEGRRSERVAWLLEELGIPYELDFVQGDILGSLLALEKHHEMRMAPVVRIGDVVMVESGAILEYLLAKYGQGSGLRPAEGSPEFPAYLEFLHFAEGTAMAKIITDVTERRMGQAMAAAGVQPPAPMKLPGLAGSRSGAQRVMHYAENTLAKRPYFAGNHFTAADIMMQFALKLGGPIASGADFNVKAIISGEKPYFDQFPSVKDFMQRMAARPAFQRAMKATMPKGRAGDVSAGPRSALLDEPLEEGREELDRRRPDPRRGLGRGGGGLRSRAPRRLAARRQRSDRSRARRNAPGPARREQGGRRAGRDDLGRRHRAPPPRHEPGQRRDDLGGPDRSAVRRLPALQDPRRARGVGLRARRGRVDRADDGPPRRRRSGPC